MDVSMPRLRGKFTDMGKTFLGQSWGNEVSPYWFGNIKSQIKHRQ